MTRRHLFFILGLAACVVLAAVFVPPPPTPNPQPFDWTLTDVRVLDPADAAQPTHDLLAVYLHPAPGELYLRVDLLDHARLPDYDLYLALDTAPAGTRRLPIDAQSDFAWDLLLAVPAFGELRVFGPDQQLIPGASLAVFRDPALDTLTLRLAGDVVPAALPRVQAFVTPAGSPQVADLTRPSAAMPVALQPARVLLAFTDTFPAYTPATALRRWNGAHTGPLGGSHGLAILLRAARKYRIPLALTDLRLPASLAALEPVGGLSLVQELAAEGLLMLPEPLLDLPPEPETVERWHSEVRRVSDGFGLPPQASAAAPNIRLTDFAAAPVVFVGRPAAILHTPGWQAPELNPTRLERQGSRKLVHLSIPMDAEQAALDGPSIEVKRGLAAAAASSNQTGGEGSFLLLGGSLPDSSWGSALAGDATLHYLSSRPWVHFLNAAELAALPAIGHLASDASGGPALPVGSPLRPDLPAGEHAALLAALQAAPDNPLTEAAWQAYWSLYAPVYPADARLPELRAAYAHDVWSLLVAAQWADATADAASCTGDPDRDGQPECVLSNAAWYAQFEAASGALTHLFSRQAGGVHQWIGPSSQMITGLSDARLWSVDGDTHTDPSALPGAFYEPGQGYAAQLEAGRLVFASADGKISKTFYLELDGITVEYTAQGGYPFTAIQGALLPDPWRRFEPGWTQTYAQISRPSEVMLTVVGQPASRLRLSSSAPLAVQAFSETLEFIPRAENPDRETPPGHYLPFPVYRIDISTIGQSQVMIRISTSP